MKKNNLDELTNEIFISMLPSLYGRKLDEEDSASINVEFEKCFCYAKSAATFLLDDKKEKKPMSSEKIVIAPSGLSAEFKVQLMLMKELLFHGYETCNEGLLVCYVFDYFKKYHLEWCDMNFSKLMDIMISNADIPDNPIANIFNSGYGSAVESLLSLYYQLYPRTFLSTAFMVKKKDSFDIVKHLVYDCHMVYFNNYLKILQTKISEEKNKEKMLSLMKDYRDYTNKRNELSKILGRDLL